MNHISDLIREVVNEKTKIVNWPDVYINKETRKQYKPHSEEERIWVYSDEPRYLLIKGGEGSGKSVALAIKTLERLRRGMSGMLVSPDMQHFKKSMFKELMRWLPREVVIEEHQRYFHPAWTPRQSFDIVVYDMYGGTATLTCAGADNPISLEGPNLSFVHMDEARRLPNESALKVLMGRTRIPGPKGEKPQLAISTTPMMNWLFDYFGPIQDKDSAEIITFKENSYVVTLLTEDNLDNLDKDYVEMRGAGLTEREKAIVLRGEWIDTENENRFVENITLWDVLKRDLPPITPKKGKTEYHDKLVIALDAGVSHDHFAMVVTSRSPFNRDNVAVRYVKTWVPPKGGKVNFSEVENHIREFCKTYNVVVCVYDPHQMHDMGTRLLRDGVVWAQPFVQMSKRSLADQGLYDKIMRHEIVHNGDTTLRTHIDNADVKMDWQENKKRIAKRSKNLPNDAAVALSMAVWETKRLNL